MKNSRRDDRLGGGRGDFKRRRFSQGSGGSGYRSRDDRAPQMHQATCADCGNPCEVPFRPTADRPVYCSNCFGKHRNEGRSDSLRDDRPRWEEKRMFSATCDNCGKLCEVPFRPSQDKPIYCNDCFSRMGKGAPRPRQSEGSGQKDLGGQFKALNAKLDAILIALSTKTAAVKEKKPIAVADKPKVKLAKKKRSK